MQLLEALHIVNGPNTSGQLLHLLRLKAKGQHVKEKFAAPLLNALLDKVLGKG